MPLTKARLERIGRLIDWVEKTKDALRYDSLTEFAKQNKVSYETIKKDMVAVAYTIMPSEKAFDWRYVPKSHKKDVRNIWEAYEKDRLNPWRARNAARIFLKHTPSMDIERLNRLYPIKSREILKFQKQIVENIEKAAEERAYAGAHIVRAYSSTWLKVGEKIHNEINRAIKQAPKEVLPQVVEDIWKANFYSSRAHRHYETFRSEYLKRLKEFKLRSTTPRGQHLPVSTPQFLKARKGFKWSEADAEKVWKRFLSDQQTLRKYYRPGKPVAIPKETKNAFKMMYYSLSPEKTRIKDPFLRFAIKSGDKLILADLNYAMSREIEEKKIRPFVSISRKKRRRKR